MAYVQVIPIEERYPIGSVVIVKALPSWVAIRIDRGYCKLKTGMHGRVIGYTAAKDKLALEFNEMVWLPQFLQNGIKRSSFDNGCHSKGETGHCLYLLPGNVSRGDHKNPPVMEQSTDNLLLLY